MNTVNKLKTSFISVFFIALILGSGYVWWAWTSSVKATSDRALSIASSMAEAMNGEMLQQVLVAPEDIGTIPYESIKTRLVSLRNVDASARFLYIYTQREGKIYFVADSEDPSSPDISPPGQEYIEADSSVYVPFSGKSLITPPETDRWGTWVSALVPIKNSKTGQVAFVFGIDYPAENWNKKALTDSARASLVVLFVLLLIGSFYILFKNNLKLKDSEEKYRIIFDHAPIGIYTINKDGVIDSFNPKMLDMNGAKNVKEVLGLNVFSLDSYKISGLDKFSREGLNGKAFNAEVKHVSQIGKKESWRHCQGVPVFLSGSKTVDVLLLLVEDITKEKEATIELNAKVFELETAKKASLNILEDLSIEKANLAEAKAKDEAMLANIGDGLVFADLEKRVLLVNRAAERMLGWKEHEVLGKLWVDIVRPKEISGKDLPPEKFILNQLMDSLSTNTSPTTDSYYYTKKDGATFPAAVTASKVFVEEKLIGAIVVFRDITKEKQIDKAKTEFVSLASHQLRTPLSTVNWYTEMLMDGDAGEVNKEQKKYLEEIYHGNQRMVELVNALLNVSQLELGTFVLEPKPTDVEALVRSVIDEQKPVIGEKKQKLITNFAKDLPKINTDPKFLRMVFQNLLSNAVKYTPEEGSIEFDILYDKEERSIKIKVADTGYGIPKNQHDKIFTKLFRADNVREKDTEGTGLGMYIVKSIVENTGGTIRFESEENKGTTFYVTLPLDGAKTLG